MRRRDLLIVAAAGLSARASATAEPPASLARGLWRDEAGRFLAIGRFPEFGRGEFAFEYSQLRIGPLRDGGDGRWRVASTLDGTGAPLAEIRPNGEDLRMRGRRFRSVRIRRTPLAAVSEGVSLSGELAMQRGRHPRGIVAMIYGSGPAPKEAFDPWAFWFLAQGFAVVTYDKRGSGQSCGDWRLTSLESLAADARAMIEAARAHTRAGPLVVWGASQAGWIEPQLGAQGIVDGLIMHAGSAMRPRAQILAHVEAELTANGFAAEEIERAKAYYALDTDVSCGVRPWNEIEAAHREAVAAGAEWILAPPAAAGAPERTMIRLMADFDPAPYWRANRASTLALFGGKDLTVPAAANRSLLESMAPAGVDLRALTLPSANHLMFTAQTGVRSEYATLSHIVPEYFSTIASWLAERA
jgi:pimeloyl-ACP methyl ester carboxylesterase